MNIRIGARDLPEILEPFDPEDVDNVIVYGSGDADADCDTCVLVGIECQPQGIEIAGLDIWLTPWSVFEGLCNLFDPHAIEPLFTGDVVLGDAERLLVLKERIEASHPGPAAIAHLSQRAAANLNSAIQYGSGFDDTGRRYFAVMALRALSYACSYHLLAQAYARRPSEGVLTLGALEGGSNNFLRMIREALRQTQRGVLPVEPPSVLMTHWLSRLYGDAGT